MADPEKAMNRAVSYYQQKGYSDAWISQRMRSIEIRKEMTDDGNVPESQHHQNMQR